MKTLMFVTGVSVGAIAAVGTSMAMGLFALNRLSGGELAKVVKNAVTDVKDTIRDRTTEGTT